MNDESIKAEVRELARQLETWRQGRGLSVAALCRTVAGINSKTFTKILEADWTELVPANHLEKYRAAVAETAVIDKRREAAETLEKLDPTERILTVAAALMTNTDNDRVAVIMGESGTGKTTALKAVARLYPERAASVTGAQSWSSLRLAVGDMLEACGFKDKLADGAAERQQQLIEWLRGNERLLLIDEGHHLDGRGWNLMRDIVNKTGSRIMIAAVSSVWRKIAPAMRAEVQQVRHNRTAVSLHLGPPTAEGVEMIFESRFKMALPGEKSAEGKAWQDAIAEAVTESAQHGNYGFIRRVCSNAIGLADRKEVTPALVRRACAATARINGTLAWK